MKITDELIDKIYKLANEHLYRDFPLYDTADMSKNPNGEGYIKKWEVRRILEAYNEVRK